MKTGKHRLAEIELAFRPRHKFLKPAITADSESLAASSLQVPIRVVRSGSAAAPSGNADISFLHVRHLSRRQSNIAKRNSKRPEAATRQPLREVGTRILCSRTRWAVIRIKRFESMDRFLFPRPTLEK